MESEDKLIYDCSRLLNQLSDGEQVLLDRYKTCGTKGHQNAEGNYCSYCYRHINYETPETNRIIEGRKHLTIYQQPLDAPLIIDQMKREIDSQKAMDFLQGLAKLNGELSSNVLLEKRLD
jgi:hypothetical protein